jgi:integrase
MQNRRPAMGFHAIFTYGVCAMSIIRRGNFWHSEFEESGERVQRTTRVRVTGPESKILAQQIENEYRQRIVRKNKAGDRGTVLFRHVAEEWIATTKGADRSRLDWLLLQVGEFEVGEVTFEVVAKIREKLTKNVPGPNEQLRADGTSYARPRSAATIERYMVVLRTILNYARKNMELEVPFVRVNKVDLNSQGKSALTQEEFARFYAELPEHLQPPLKFAVGTGLRTGSVLSMTWDRILPCGTKFFVPARDLKGKIGETNDIGLPLNELALDALRAARAYAPPATSTDFIFQYRDPALTSITDRQMREVARELLVKPGALGQRGSLGQRELRQELLRKFKRCGGTSRLQRICREETEAFLARGNTVARINHRAESAGASTRPLRGLGGKALKKAMIRAGLEGKNVVPHTMRHTFATWLLNLGLPEHLLMKLGNWQTLDMMRHYAYLQGDTLAAAAALMPTPKLEEKGALRLVGSSSVGAKVPAKSPTAK